MIVEPRDRLVRQALDPRIGRVNVFKAEPPDGRRLEKVGDVPICGAISSFEVNKPAEPRRVGTARGVGYFHAGEERTHERLPPCG